MLTRSQLLLLTVMATLGGSFAGLLVVGIFANDYSFAIVNLGLIFALFGSVFVFSGDKLKKKKRAGEVHVGGELHEDFK